MNNDLVQSNNRQVGIWLLIGVGMLIIQVLLGGITRLTESGLSITEWKPITGILPPMDTVSWQAEFDKYKLTDQFRYVHVYFTLEDFKFIFFWEWFHRAWARLISVVFIVGFVYFLVRNKFNKGMILPMIILFLLGALQGVIGWIMVKSGLVPEKYFVGHVELATHFMAAMGLLCYVLWFALSLLVQQDQFVVNTRLNQLFLFIMVVLFFQLIYGSLMAGLKAAQSAPTWPAINSYFIPPTLYELTPLSKNLISNNITVQFIHRALAYLLMVMIIIAWLRSGKIKNNRLLNFLRASVLFFVLVQVILGILTVINATVSNRFVLLGVSHQFIGMLLLMTVVSLFYVLRKKRILM